MSKLYYCLLWRNFHAEPMTKFIYAEDVPELTKEFLEMGYAAFSITEITNREVDSFEL